MGEHIKIAGRTIGAGNPVFIIAEISGNHNQDFKRAAELVKRACEAGADAVKLQTYTPDTLTIDSDKEWFKVKTTNKDWDNQTLYGLYKTAYTPWEWQPALQKIAASYGVPLFSTPFDETAVDFLEKMRVPLYKVASFEIGDLELLKRIGKTRKPVIMSRGLATLAEIRLGVRTLRAAGAQDVAVLHCVSSYPARFEEMNLSTIPALAKKLHVVVGLSDHSLGIEAALGAVALGASIIEKHITLKRSDGGPDAAFSLEIDEFKQLVDSVRHFEQAIGSPSFSPGKRESENLVFRRSLFIVEDIKRGETFTKQNVRSIRPGFGLAPRFLPSIIGKRAVRDIERGTPLSAELIEGEILTAK